MAETGDVLASQRTAWAALAPGWSKWDRVIMDQLRPVTTAMIDLLGVAANQRHLDVAAGTGEPGLSVAQLAPRGRVVLTDLSADMLAVAAERARVRGLANVEFRECSADDLPFDDATFDSVSVRFGHMFFPDVASATQEIVRVLRPGGRVCSSVWVDPEANPWTAITMAAVAAEVPLPQPDPDAPSMFRCAAPGYVRALYEAAGLRDVHERDVTVELVTRTPDEYWDVMSEHVSLVVAALGRADDVGRARIAASAIAGAAAYDEGGRVAVPGRARCVVGTR